jgi:hypothetical protein
MYLMDVASHRFRMSVESSDDLLAGILTMHAAAIVHGAGLLAGMFAGPFEVTETPFRILLLSTEGRVRRVGLVVTGFLERARLRAIARWDRSGSSFLAHGSAPEGRFMNFTRRPCGSLLLEIRVAPRPRA